MDRHNSKIEQASPPQEFIVGPSKNIKGNVGAFTISGRGDKLSVSIDGGALGTAGGFGGGSAGGIPISTLGAIEFGGSIYDPLDRVKIGNFTMGVNYKSLTKNQAFTRRAGSFNRRANASFEDINIWRGFIWATKLTLPNTLVRIIGVRR